MKLLMFTLLCFQFAWASTSTDNPRPQMWPDRMWSSITQGLDQSGSQLTNIIFNLIDDNTISFFSSNDNSAKLVVQRRVFDNQDVLRSWTVSDTVGVELGRDATEFTIPIFPSVVSPVEFKFGIGGRLLVTHIRQVSATKYSEIPRIDETKKEVEAFQKEEEERIRKREKDPSFSAHFGRLWNGFTAPFKIPFTKEALKKINSGEIISYSAGGFVSVGLEAGFLPLKVTNQVDLTFGMGVQAYVKGEFRITVLKEDERFVRVKLTRSRSLGKGFTAGAETSDIIVHEGFILAGQEIDDITVSLVPFKFSTDSETQKQSDIGYRFDLENEEAEMAYEKAIKGNFFFAEQHSRTNPAISSILSRESKLKRRTTAFALGFNWLARTVGKREKKDLWVTIEQPGSGKKHIFKSSFELLKQWGTIWGDGEKKDFLFSTILDSEAYERHEDNSFQLMTEALIEDVKTNGHEMHDYIRNVEAVIGDSNVLPELPILVPTGSGRLRKAKYHRSSFYFGQYFSQKQVLKFLGTSAAKAWEISYKSFDYLKNPFKKKRMAKRFYRHWMKLQEKFKENMPVKELTERLVELKMLFRYHRQSIHAMRAILMGLENEEIDYFLTATNNTFGRVSFRGRAITNAEKLLQLADETIDFENRVGSPRPNPDALIKDFKVEQFNGDLKLTFNLPKNTNYLFFRVLRTSGWKKIKNLKELIYVNRVRFKPGPNTWIIKSDSTDPLDVAILEAFKTSDYYTFQICASIDRQTWGRVESSRFKFTPLKSEKMVRNIKFDHLFDNQ